VKLGRAGSLVLLLPAVVWSVSGIKNMIENGFYSYTFLLPLPFRTHTVSVLNISIFYLVAFIMIRPHEPIKNFSISCSLLFLSNAVYELIYGIFYDWTSLIVTVPLVICGIIVSLFLNRRFHFLSNDKNRILLFIVLFGSLVTVMLTLNNAGFFAEMRLYLSGQTADDPHNPLWILSKTLSVWMFLMVLRPVFIRNQRNIRGNKRTTLPDHDAADLLDAAETMDEARKLVEAGFEYVCSHSNIMLFKKRK